MKTRIYAAPAVKGLNPHKFGTVLISVYIDGIFYLLSEAVFIYSIEPLCNLPLGL